MGLYVGQLSAAYGASTMTSSESSMAVILGMTTSLMVAPSRASANTAAAPEGGFVRHREQTWFGTAARGIPSMGD